MSERSPDREFEILETGAKVMQASIDVSLLKSILRHVAWGLFSQVCRDTPQTILDRIPQEFELLISGDKPDYKFFEELFQLDESASATWGGIINAIRAAESKPEPSDQALEQAQFDAAIKLFEWNGWVYWPDSPDLSAFTPEGKGIDGGYYASADVILAAIAAHNAARPEPIQAPSYVWCCQPTGVQQFDSEGLMIHEFESLYEGAWNEVPAKAILNLDAALREFYKATRHIRVPRESYHFALLVGVCPAQVERSGHYPKEWGDRVPKTIRMLETVVSDIPFTSLGMASVGEQYPAWTNSHGAVSAVLPGGYQLGVKPGEFEIVEWWE